MSGQNREIGRRPGEEWRVVPGHPDHEVSSLGRVRRRTEIGRWPAGHVLRPGAQRSGHLYVLLPDENSRSRKRFIHRLVALAFLDPAPFDGAYVLHADDDPANNIVANLSWGTAQDNAFDARLNRKRPVPISQRGAQPGAGNSSTVLTEEAVREIRRQVRDGFCGSCLARLHGVSRVTIYAIAKRRIWKHLPEESEHV